MRHVGSFIVALVLALGLLSSRGVQVFSSLVGTRAPESVGSVVCRHSASLVETRELSIVVRGLSCPLACGILVPQPGIKCASPALEGGFFYHWITKEVPRASGFVLTCHLKLCTRASHSISNHGGSLKSANRGRKKEFVSCKCRLDI